MQATLAVSLPAATRRFWYLYLGNTTSDVTSFVHDIAYDTVSQGWGRGLSSHPDTDLQTSDRRRVKVTGPDGWRNGRPQRDVAQRGTRYVALPIWSVRPSHLSVGLFLVWVRVRSIQIH